MGEAGTVILTYHSIDTSGTVISTPPAVFLRQAQALAESGTPVVPLCDAGRIPGSVALTFDDGFRNFLEQAAPVLAQYRLPATVFVVTGYCGGRNNWPSQPRGVPALELMGWSDLNEVSRLGITLGAHTVQHPDLTALPPEQAARQMRDSRKQLEDRSGRPVTAFAYPYGRANASVRRLAEAEFQLACGTRLGFATAAAPRFDLPRIDTYYLLRGNWFEKVIRGRGRAYISARRLLRSARPSMLS